MNKSTSLPAALLIAFLLPPTAQAQSYDHVVQAEVLPGWRNADGSHTAALHLTLNPGWKTYWRAPGDAGIPPQVSWKGSRNLSNVSVQWPTPSVFSQNGMRSIGYTEELILPIQLAPNKTGETIRLKAVLDIGVCRDICVPQRLNIRAELPVQGARDARIAAAMADQPLSRSEANVGKVVCALSPTQDGVALRASITMPSAGGTEIAVVETGNPEVWVAEGTTQRHGNTLVTETEMVHIDEKPFLVDRSELRFTVLGRNHAVDILGCSSS